MKAAILLQVGDLYENREAGGQGAAAQYFRNPTYERVLNPYRVMTV
ncbi:head-tail connector protein [Cupriavidus gilardii]|nr:head-tail connector protein [Cupriavidus gilardii]